MTKETRKQLIDLATEMREEAVEKGDETLLAYARRLCVITNANYEQPVNRAVGVYGCSYSDAGCFIVRLLKGGDRNGELGSQ